ncbi:IS3 family transposase [Sulfoacidibacillus ferrooxidans]|uniref:IS3 family transposase n=1 Tax=Sulfoacidibacillus ferrooxidans TaxID=2005001 RepID=UPI003AFA5041
MAWFHSVLKRELVYLEKFTTREQAKKRMFKYIEVWYNRERIQSSTAYISLMEYKRKIFPNAESSSRVGEQHIFI